MADYPTDYRAPWIDDNGFLCVRTGSERRTRVALERDLGVAAGLTAGGRRRTIWDARAAANFDVDAWVALIDRLGSIVTALAVLVSDSTTPQATVFAEQIDMLFLPCCLFEDESAAVAWLNAIGP